MSHAPAVRPSPHRRRPPDAWARIRRDYASGVPARVAAERGGVSLSTLRARARKEGWRRTDGCGPPAPADWSPTLEAGLEGDPALLAEEAWLNAARFLQLGRLSEASAWARMAAHCRRAARDAEREEAGALSVLPRILSGLSRSVGRMPTPESEATLRRVFEHVMDAVSELRDPQPSAAPECKSQAPVAEQLSAELHQLHTPGEPPLSAHRPSETALPRESGDPGVLSVSDLQSQSPPSASQSGPAEEKAWVPAFARKSGEEASDEPEPATLAPPWAALHARPEDDLTWAERCVRRRVNDHRLPSLWTSDRPKALHLWSRWRAEFDIDPDCAIGAPTGLCVSDATPTSGLRVALL